ncbi:MAG TPA: hypothetical protein VL995_20810 [Cellvibrio sp.]|nr:hypothetical protein [Cellvibrio sp.]
MNNSNTSDVSENPPPNIRKELAQLCDSYCELQHYCAFYCQSTSVIIHRFAHDLDADSIEGIERFAYMVIKKADAINAQLKWLMNNI